jgi:hypothetical protein
MSSTKKSTTTARRGKGGWAATMKTALAKKRPPGGWPAQGQPRDSVVQKVKKNAF